MPTAPSTFSFLVLRFVLQITSTENFWQSHMNSLWHIIAQRRGRPEPFPYVIFWCSLIDICALLSGRGDGALAADLTRENAMPPAESLRRCPPVLSGGDPSDGYPWGGGPNADHAGHKFARDIGDAAWNLYCEACLAAAKVGHLARGMREAARAQDGGVHPEQGQSWAGQAEVLRDVINHGWRSLLADGGTTQRLGRLAALSSVSGEQLDPLVRDLFDYVSAHSA